MNFDSWASVAVLFHSFLILQRKKLQGQVLETLVLLGPGSEKRINKYGHFRAMPFIKAITSDEHYVLLPCMRVLLYIPMG